ncbi:MAG: hypothetical protein Q9200_003734 [Gallowayella weberi]
MKDQAAVVEPQANIQSECDNNVGDTSNASPNSHVRSNDTVDEHAPPSEKPGQEVIIQHDSKNKAPGSDSAGLRKLDEDAVSEGTDVCDEDTSWRHSHVDKSLDERRKKAPKRIKQYSDYIKLMEDRMGAMEEQLQKLVKPAAETVTEATYPPPPPPPSPPKQLHLSIAHMKWETFDIAGKSGQHVIDVLIGDPDYMKSRQQKKAAKQEEKNKYTDHKEKKAGDEEKREEPESTQLRHASAVEKRSLLPERICMVGPLIIIRPFKLLIHWEQEIKHRLAFLERRWEEIDASAEQQKRRTSMEVKADNLTAGVRKDKESREGAAEIDSKSTVDPSNTYPSTADGTVNVPEAQLADKGKETGSTTLEKHDNQGTDQNSDLTTQKQDEQDSHLDERDNIDTTDASTAIANCPREHEVGSQDPEYDDLSDDLFSTDGKPALRRLRLLVKFIDEEVNAPLAKLKEGHRHQQVFFADLYHFFAPGDEVYRFHGSGTNEQVQAYRVLQVVGGKRFNFSEKPKGDADTPEMLSSTEIGSPLVITCIHIDFDGKEFGPVTTSFSIREYAGERTISALPICPVAFIKDSEDLQRALEVRGQRFVELAQVSHKEYTGLTIDPVEDIDSQVIIDFDTTFQNNRSWAPELDIQYPAAGDPRETAPLPASQREGLEPKGTVFDSFDNEYSWMFEDALIDQIRMKDFMDEHPIFSRDSPVLLKATQDGVELNNDDKRLLPGRVFGFVLRSRTWAALSIRLVKDLPMKQDGFDQLVLPDGHKDLVRALVKTHSRGARPASRPIEEKDHQVDLVKGKGKGLIILLHGVPGVGKTSTAEYIADYTQRPLFPITCGDIGETATSVEANLGKSFQLAHKWGCVLLLDEADVFMAKRSGSDIQRNSLVSVFLRILEVGIFDPAFKSRIHISLYYPPLNGVTTIKIWRVNIDRTRLSEKGYEVDEAGILEFAKSHFLAHDEGGRWNGRQIRNAFQTAIALAEYDVTEDTRRRFDVSESMNLPPLKPRITVEHFRKVASAASDFDRYLKDVYGGRDESDRAFGESLRKDDWGQQTVVSMRPPIRGGNSSQGYHQQGQYRQQRQRFNGRNVYHSEASFDEVDPFQESKHPALPNEAENFNRPSPDPRAMARAERGGYDEFGSHAGSSNSQSPWNVSGGPGQAGRLQTPQDNRSRMRNTAHFEESEYKMEMTNDFSEFGESDDRDVRGIGRDGQGVRYA